jgi:hypothetical protein
MIPHIEFTYTSIDGIKLSVSKEVDVLCCPDCEMEFIGDIFDVFSSCAASLVADKYIHPDDIDKNKEQYDEEFFDDEDEDCGCDGE